MEITNNSDFVIPLIVGRTLAQIVFMYTGPVETSYENKRDSKYQNSGNLETLINEWNPENMLPKLYK